MSCKCPILKSFGKGPSLAGSARAKLLAHQRKFAFSFSTREAVAITYDEGDEQVSDVLDHLPCQVKQMSCTVLNPKLRFKRL